MGEKVRENRLRRVAERRGLQLRKCRRRDPGAFGHGGYVLVDPNKDVVVVGASPHEYGFSLDQIEEYLSKNKSQTDPNYLEEVELRKGIKICCQRVNELLDTVLVLADHQTGLSIALSIYTLAIEEHGKALMLGDVLAKKVPEKYAVSRSIFKEHKKKFRRGAAHLPKDCQQLLRAVAVISNASNNLVPVSYGDLPGNSELDEDSLASVVIDAGTTGTFTDLTGVGSEVPVDFFFDRFRSFYVDWDEHKKEWVGDWHTEDQLTYQWVPDRDALTEAIVSFKGRIKSLLETIEL